MNDKIYRTEKEKNEAILKKVIECNKNGQPVLVGTTSIDKSEKISSLLNKNKLKHNVLNAKHHEQEARIIAEAGQTGSVTIATNMAGRGTDIKLGGNKDYVESGVTAKRLNKSNQFDEDQKKVRSLGGLAYY